MSAVQIYRSACQGTLFPETSNAPSIFGIIIGGSVIRVLASLVHGQVLISGSVSVGVIARVISSVDVSVGVGVVAGVGQFPVCVFWTRRMVKQQLIRTFRKMV